MVWGSYIQSGNLEEIDQLGSKLSVVIHCSVHFPAYNKNLFECHCGVVFPYYLLKGDNWKLVKHKHEEEKGLAILL